MGRPKATEHIICSCGQRVAKGGESKHETSTFHNNYNRFKTLLASNCVTLTEIGRRLGVSKQRVHQLINKQTDASGRQRVEQCTLAKRKAVLEELTNTCATVNPLFDEIKQICENKNFQFRLIETRMEKSRRQPSVSKQSVFINGMICHIGRLTTYKIGNREYYRVGGSTRKIYPPAFRIMKGSHNDWWIIPGTNTNTGWSPAPLKSFGTKETKHNQREWRENWEALKT